MGTDGGGHKGVQRGLRGDSRIQEGMGGGSRGLPLGSGGIFGVAAPPDPTLPPPPPPERAGVDADGDQERGGLREVFQRPDHRPVRPGDLGGRAHPPPHPCPRRAPRVAPHPKKKKKSRGPPSPNTRVLLPPPDPTMCLDIPPPPKSHPRLIGVGVPLLLAWGGCPPPPHAGVPTDPAAGFDTPLSPKSHPVVIGGVSGGGGSVPPPPPARMPGSLVGDPTRCLGLIWVGFLKKQLSFLIYWGRRSLLPTPRGGNWVWPSGLTGRTGVGGLLMVPPPPSQNKEN